MQLPILCRACVHLRPGTDGCDAFRHGIPLDIRTGADHRTAHHGDHGIRFEQAPGPEAIEAFSDWQDYLAPAS